MEITLYMNTHGLGIRDEKDWWLQLIPVETTKPVEVTQLAKRSRFHSLWFSDHLAKPPLRSPLNTRIQETGRKSYAAGPSCWMAPWPWERRR